MKDGSIIPLPGLSDKSLTFEHFPTAMQAFIFRNWDMVPKERLALVLGTSVENIERQADKMGLGPQRDVSQWAQKGYITIIRSNWHILTYEQLLLLLGWDKERLALVLKEDDFLYHKLANFKPFCETLTYRELSDEDERKTGLIKDTMLKKVRRYDNEIVREPFDFFNPVYPDIVFKKSRNEKYKAVLTDDWVIVDHTNDGDIRFVAEGFMRDIKSAWGVNLSFGTGVKNCIVLKYGFCEKKAEYHEVDIKEDCITITAKDNAGILRGLTYLSDLARLSGGAFFEVKKYERSPRFGARFIYSFCGLYNDAFDVDSEVYCPDELLSAYSKLGVNGIWTQAVLYRITKFPYEKSISEGWRERLENLRRFVNRAKKFGIKIYLYLNEPRSMPLSFFEEYPEMKGAVRGDFACMCTSSPKVQEYLHNAVTQLCKSVPDLGGLFTITMSENMTNCYSVSVDEKCPVCSARPAYEVVAQVNSIIASAAHSINKDIHVIAWDWAWSGELFDEKSRLKCVELMPKDVIVMCQRESGIPFTIGGISGVVRDYSLSIEGISPVSKVTWDAAKRMGHQTAAKMQINNTWECSTATFLPVYRLLMSHLNALVHEDIGHIMLSWTLGGYPSPNIKLASGIFFEDVKNNSDVGLNEILETMYGDYAEAVGQATDIFSEAFKEFPFHVDTLYNAPQNAGVSNLLFAQPTGFNATMTCYSYDDLESWRSIYPQDIFENQFKLLCEKWEKGLKKLEALPECELKDMAFVGYSLFKASYNQIRFVRARDKFSASNDDDIKKELISILDDEAELTEKVYRIMLRNPSVGYEAANHYYYSRGMLAEKMVNCEYLKTLYSRGN